MYLQQNPVGLKIVCRLGDIFSTGKEISAVMKLINIVLFIPPFRAAMFFFPYNKSYFFLYVMCIYLYTYFMSDSFHFIFNYHTTFVSNSAFLIKRSRSC